MHTITHYTSEDLQYHKKYQNLKIYHLLKGLYCGLVPKDHLQHFHTIVSDQVITVVCVWHTNVLVREQGGVEHEQDCTPSAVSVCVSVHLDK